MLLKRVLSFLLLFFICFGFGPFLTLDLHPLAQSDNQINARYFEYEDTSDYIPTHPLLDEKEYPLGAITDDYTGKNSKYEYIIHSPLTINGYAEITAYFGDDESVSVPSNFEGYPVYKICDSAFSDNIYLTDLVFPNTVHAIGRDAFSNCYNLRSVFLPKDLYEIGQNAFANCVNLKSINIPKNLYEIDVGSIIYHRGDSVGPFLGCSELNTVSFEVGINCIPDYLFCDCSGLKSITIPNSIERIGEAAFSNCGDLETVLFEKDSKLIELAAYAFTDCKELNEITLPNSLNKIDSFAFLGCEKLNNLVLPNQLKVLRASFINESGITSITIPNSLETADSPFADNKLEIVFESDVKTIPACFYEFSTFDTIIVPETITSIEYFAFGFCTYLEKVYIPSSVTYIDEDAFFGIDPDVHNIAIYGYLGTTAEQFANNHGFEFVGVDKQFANENNIPYNPPINPAIPTQNDNDHTEPSDKPVNDNSKPYYSWLWGKDNYSFINEPAAFHEYTFLTFKDHQKLIHSLNATDLFTIGAIYGADVIEGSKLSENNSFPRASTRYINFMLNQMNKFGGACYGMSLTAALMKANMLNPNDYGANSTFGLFSRDVESLINYYQMSQSVTRDLFNTASTVDKRFGSFIQSMFDLGLKVMEKDSNHDPFIVGLNYHGSDFSDAHAVICYGAEYGSWTFEGNRYHKRLLIADPNLTLSDYDERGQTCIYINDDNSFAVYSYKPYFNVFNYCSSLSILKNFELYKPDNYYLNRLFTYGNNVIIKGSNWKSSIIGDNVRKISGNMPITVNYLANQDEDNHQSSGECYYSFNDSSDQYTLMPFDDTGNNKPLSAALVTPKALVGFEAVATSAEISNDGNLLLKSVNGECTIGIAQNDVDFGYVSIIGQADGNVTINSNNESLLVSGEISDYLISNINKEAETETLVVPGKTKAKVIIKNNHLAAMADMDNNGTYETQIDSVKPNLNGIFQGSDGKWAMYKEGIVDTSTTGVFQNKYGWWRVEKGYVNFDAQGIYHNQYGWWKTTNGKVTFRENGVYQNQNGWWRVKDSKVDFNAQGIYQNKNGWWKTTNGKVTFKENGVFQNENGWWIIKDSKVDFKFTGIASNKYGSWYVREGKVDFTKNGNVTYDKKTYTIRNGKVV